MSSRPSPEKRIKVADFSTHVSGPTASLFLRAVGAEVVKIENARYGDGNRNVPAAPRIGENGIYHQALNWGARSVAADARGPEWPRWVRAMTEWADVVIVGGRPSDVRRLGLDREAIVAMNSRVIHCFISGYGPTGPWAERAAHGQNPDALAALVDLTTDESGDPIISGWQPGGTSFAGASAALGILAALWHRSERDVILNVETSLWESAVWWNWRQLTAAANHTEAWGRVKDWGSRYGAYRTSDERPVLVAPIEEKFWRIFCDQAGLGDLRDTGDWSTRYDFGEQTLDGPERARIAQAMKQRSLSEWTELLEPSGIPFCEILTAEEVSGTQQAKELDLFVPLQNAEGVAIRPPVRLRHDGAPAFQVSTRLPDLGEATVDFRGLVEEK